MAPGPAPLGADPGRPAPDATSAYLRMKLPPQLRARLLRLSSGTAPARSEVDSGTPATAPAGIPGSASGVKIPDDSDPLPGPGSPTGPVMRRATPTPDPAPGKTSIRLALPTRDPPDLPANRQPVARSVGPEIPLARTAPPPVVAVEGLGGPPSEATRALLEVKPPAEPGEYRALDLVTVRQATLKNQLDLSIETLRPELAKEARRGAEARFDPIGFATAAQAGTKTENVFQQVEGDSTTLEVGVRVPLPTGGTVSISIPSQDQAQDTFGFGATRTAQDGSSLSIAITQPLLRNGGPFVNRAPIFAARLAEDQSRARASLAITTLIGAADQAYWLHWANSQLVEIRRRQYTLALSLLEQVTKLVKGGLIARIETVRARSGVTRRVGAVLQAETARRNSQYELQRIMNRDDIPVGSPVALLASTPPDLTRYQIDPDALVATGYERRMDLLDAELQLAIDALNARVAKNQVRPTLDFSLSVRDGDNDQQAGAVQVSNDTSNWTAGLSFELPFGNRAAKALSRQRELQRILSLRTVALRKLQIQKDVASASAALDLAWNLILSARQDTQAASAIFQTETLQFELGERTTTEVLEAAQFLADAQISEVFAMRDYELAKIDLARSAGMLIEYGGLTLDP